MAINGTLADINLQTLSAAAASLTDNASKGGIFIYDTSQDSDGGAWRYRTHGTSWYNETLNTTYRGSRREFPAIAIIVAQNTNGGNVRIYDGDDPDLPMWMEFNLPAYAPGANWNQSIVGIGYVNTNAYTPGALCMMNGLLAIGNISTTAAFHGAHLVNFISDEMTTCANYGNAPNQFYRNGKIVDRNDTTVVSHLERYGNSEFRSDIEGRIANPRVNDTAMAVLPGAAIEEKTGLPYVTVAFATAGGVTVIRDDYEMTGYNTAQQRYAIKLSSNSSTYSHASNITFTDEGYLWWTADNNGSSYVDFRDTYLVHTRQLVKMGQTNVQWDPSSNQFNGNGAHDFYSVSTGSEAGEIQIGPNPSEFTFKYVDRNAVAGPAGLAFQRPSVWARDDRRGFAYIATADYVSGWMSGNECKMAALANSATQDRSIMNHDLTLTGGLTTAPVATNSDITAYSGFSSSNYLEHTNGVNYGVPAVITMMCWLKMTNTVTYNYMASVYDSTNSRVFGIAINADGSGLPGVPYVYDSINAQLAAPSDVRVNDGQWHHVCATMVHSGGQGRRDFYVDGRYVAGGTTSTVNLSAVNNTAIGHYNQGGGRNYHFSGSLALVRISNDRLHPRDIKWIYESERELFRPESRGTIYGSSSDVTALAYDQVRGEYHVGTSAGRSVFKGLNRINNTTTAVTTAISVADGIVAEQ